ncbi:MAG TPA: fibronectin type III domain-containing protein, partial [Pyrinomonadaceae bacterium]|nr:fibronectin type III domain-containing protein [Pyrinomonadaceae bacterium]
VVDRGQINVRTEEQPLGTSNVVQTRQTQSKLGPQTGASFGINPDSTEDIRVSQGQMETTSVKTGETTTVRGGEYLSINPSGNIARREKLLDVPAPVAPHDLERIFVGASGAAGVTLRWQRPVSGSAAHYRVEVATSPFFVAAGKVIERDQLASTEFNASDLRPGNYFWRVRATATTGQISDWTDPQKFIVVPAGSNENLAVDITETNYIGGQIYLVRGRAQPGTTIRILGRQTLTGSDGSFQLQITVPEGAREVAGEAQDPQGNRTRFNFALGGKRAA